MELPLWKALVKKTQNPLSEIQNFLHHTVLFGELPRRTLREVARLIHKRSYYNGEVIFRQGQAGLGLFLIMEGKVEIFSERDGIQMKLADLHRGAFFGELSLFSDEPRSATAICKEETILLGFFQPELEQLIKTKPRSGNEILMRFSRVITERLLKTNEVLEKAYLKGKLKREGK